MTQTISGVGDSLWTKRSAGLHLPVSRKRFPIDGLVFYAPLWHPQLNTSPFLAWDIANGSTHSCTVSGATWSSTGRFFDQDNDKITIPAHAAMANIFAGGGTISAWINPGSDGELNVGRILEKRAGGVGWRFIVEQEDVGGKVKLHFVQDRATTDGDWLTTATAVTIDTFSLVTVTYDSDLTTNNPTIYVNNSTVGLTETGPPDGATVDDTAVDLLIGTEATLAAVFDGTIGDCWLYTKVLTAQEIQNIHLATKWRYS